VYHGDRVPGFPQHPHRGFETITYLKQGVTDHTDSLGNAGRFSDGDAQLMTAGKGCVHGEMFPLIHKDKPNTLRLFQIWLNLPAKNKFAEPSYEMLWRENSVRVEGKNGAYAMIVTGRIGEADGTPKLNPASWAADPKNDVGCFTIDLPAKGAAGASSFTLPPAVEGAGINRTLYFVEGSTKGAVTVGGKKLTGRSIIKVKANEALELINEDEKETAEFLVLQGRPIGEPVAQHGPFVMNTQKEIMEAFGDYRATRFGGWPWADDAPVFPASQGRFALHVKKGGEKFIDYPPSTPEEVVKGQVVPKIFVPGKEEL
jgi:quercetin 2,3-dioxygenase